MIQLGWGYDHYLDAPLRMGAALQSGPLRTAHSLNLRRRTLTNLSAQWWRGGSRRYEMVNVK